MRAMEEEKRIYGRWAGNPKGHPEDVTRCIESVTGDGRASISGQCDRRRGHGRDGLYCKQHDPEAVRARSAARAKKWDDKLAAQQRGWDLTAKRAEVARRAQSLVKVRSFGQEFDALAKAVEELGARDKNGSR